jgi:hypothetical protein
MLTLRIKNQKVENQFIEFSKHQNKAIDILAIDAIKSFMKLSKQNKLNYTKKNPLKHTHKRLIEYDEEMCDDVALTHIQDSASYIHDLRRQGEA